MRGRACVQVDGGEKAYRTSRSVSLRMFIRLRNVFTGSWGGGAAYGNWKQNKTYYKCKIHVMILKSSRIQLLSTNSRHSSGHHREVGLVRWPQLLPVSPQHRKVFRFVSTDLAGADKCWGGEKKKICSDFCLSRDEADTSDRARHISAHTGTAEVCEMVSGSNKILFLCFEAEDQTGWGLPHQENFNSSKITDKDVKYLKKIKHSTFLLIFQNQIKHTLK